MVIFATNSCCLLLCLLKYVSLLFFLWGIFLKLNYFVGDHALLDLTCLAPLKKRTVTVKTKSGENLSIDSAPCVIPLELLKGVAASLVRLFHSLIVCALKKLLNQLLSWHILTLSNNCYFCIKYLALPFYRALGKKNSMYFLTTNLLFNTCKQSI